MKKAVLRYGGISALFMVVFFFFEDLLFEKEDFGNKEIFGWTGILLSTILVFFGIKYYRDRVNNGVLSFGKGLQVGLLILIIPSVAFGLFNVIYVWLHPEFLDSYYNYEINNIKASLPPTEANLEIESMEKKKKWFMSPAVQFLVMFFSVFAIGLIVTVISSVVLRRGKTRVQHA